MAEAEVPVDAAVAAPAAAEAEAQPAAVEADPADEAGGGGGDSSGDDSSSSDDEESFMDQALMDALGLQVVQTSCGFCQKPAPCNVFRKTVPFFREIIIMSLRCGNCGARDSWIEQSEVGDEAVEYVLTATSDADLKRQVVKSTAAVVQFVELGLEIPSTTQAGTFNTVEGLLQQMVDGLKQVRAGGDRERVPLLARIPAREFAGAARICAHMRNVVGSRRCGRTRHRTKRQGRRLTQRWLPSSQSSWRGPPWCVVCARGRVARTRPHVG